MDTDTARPLGPVPMVFILDEANVGGWEGVASIVLEHRYPDGPKLPVWPRQYGKQILVQEYTLEGPRSDTARTMLKPFIAQLLVRRDRTVHRLAHHLGLHPETVRGQLDQVQHVLEVAGIGDGYGCLTLTQPVRPPVIWTTP